MVIPFNTYQVTIWGKEKAVCCSPRALVSLPFLLRLWLTCLKFKFSPLRNGPWMGLQWNWLSRYIYFNWGLLFFQYGNWCWKKSKKNLPSLNWPHLLESSLLNFAEQAIWQSHSRGAHGEGELQADLKDWNLLLSKQTGENGAEVNRGSDCLSSSTLPTGQRKCSIWLPGRSVLHMKHPAEHVTMVHGRGEPNSLPGSGLDYSRQVHELED